MLPDKIPLLLAIDPRQVDGALAFDKSHHLRNRLLRWDGDHHMHMIDHQMPFLDPAFFLRRESLENFPKVLAQLAVKRLPAAFGNKHDVVFAVPFRVT